MVIGLFCNNTIHKTVEGEQWCVPQHLPQPTAGSGSQVAVVLLMYFDFLLLISSGVVNNCYKKKRKTKTDRGVYRVAPQLKI